MDSCAVIHSSGYAYKGSGIARMLVRNMPAGDMIGSRTIMEIVEMQLDILTLK